MNALRSATARSALFRPAVLGTARHYSAPAVSSVALQDIETRWTKLPEAEQGAIADLLAEAEKGDWKKMTLEQKRAAYFIAYGAYGPRQETDPNFKWRVGGWVTFFLTLTGTIWGVWQGYRPKTISDTPEWREATKQKAIERKQNPFQGAYAEVRAKDE
ncbi:cytochrome c oxidase subunit IV-domain-containing protein [Cladochytrium replicatum]|nr:cytochrome c oxidase subunit IV-domain-containing protein [Cladochytrium replicatum]